MGLPSGISRTSSPEDQRVKRKGLDAEPSLVNHRELHHLCIAHLSRVLDPPKSLEQRVRDLNTEWGGEVEGEPFPQSRWNLTAPVGRFHGGSGRW